MGPREELPSSGVVKKRRGANEVLPGVLYQRGHFLTWSYREKGILLQDYGIDTVVNLWRPVDGDLANRAIYLTWHMETDEPPKDATALVGFVAYLLRRGHTALVHCEAGRNRSAWLCARLVREVAGVGPEEALRVVREAIPNAAINKVLLEDIMTAPAIYRSE